MTAAAPAVYTQPQAGKQRLFLANQADICLYGGAAGGGKSYGLLLEALRHVKNPQYQGVIFRRTTPEIRLAGGLWDESMGLYPSLGGMPMETRLLWRFPSGATVQFRHLEYDKTKLELQGSQVAFFGFDELITFLLSQFTFLVSRLRSASGVRPYIRATTNPHALSWVKEFFAPWVDDQYPDKALDGEVRWFIRDGDSMLWVPEGTKHALSVAFIHADVYDNPALLQTNPEYLAKLHSLPSVDRARLLHGDWNAVEGGNMFRREWFDILAEHPRELRLVRSWDMASTEPVKPGQDPDWTVGTLMGIDGGGIVWVLDMIREQLTPGSVKELVRTTAESDKARFGQIAIRMEQEPGSSGVTVIDDYQKLLIGYDFQGCRSTGSKAERAKPLSAYAEARNVKLVAAYWNHHWRNELAAFPTQGPGIHDDCVDSASLGFNELAQAQVLEFS